MSDIQNKINSATLSMADAKDRVIIDDINELISKDVLVFYDQRFSSQYDPNTHTFAIQGACKLTTTRRIDQLQTQLTTLQSENKALKEKLLSFEGHTFSENEELKALRECVEFYGDSDKMHTIVYESNESTLGYIHDDDDFDYVNGKRNKHSGKRARLVLAQWKGK